MKGGGGLAKALEKYGKGRVVAKVGILDGATYPDGESVAQVAFENEFGIGNKPPRAFFRKAIEENREAIKVMAVKLLSKHDDAETVIRLLCDYMVDELKMSVINFSDPPNAPYTVKKKGFNNPLIETRQLLRSFSYEVIDDES